MKEESTRGGHATAERTDKLERKTDGRSVSVRTDVLTDSQRRAQTPLRAHQPLLASTQAAHPSGEQLGSGSSQFMSSLFVFAHRDPDVKEFKLAGSHYRATTSPCYLPVSHS